MIFGKIKIRQNRIRINAAKLHRIFKYFTDCFIICHASLSFPKSIAIMLTVTWSITYIRPSANVWNADFYMFKQIFIVILESHNDCKKTDIFTFY